MKPFALVTATLVGLSLAGGVYAAGGGGTKASTKSCKKKGKVYDKKKKKCVDANRAGNDSIYEAAMGLAYGGKYQDAIDILKVAGNQDDPRILNYLGFSHRKLGKTQEAMVFYTRALELDPNYHLARSYMAQGLVADGDYVGARQQLAELKDRGAEGSWPYVMLENAIVTGTTY
ncbi:MAG: tetratricopeptide repeat protein [Pseudomonadota bacterium]